MDPSWGVVPFIEWQKTTKLRHVSTLSGSIFSLPSPAWVPGIPATRAWHTSCCSCGLGHTGATEVLRRFGFCLLDCMFGLNCLRNGIWFEWFLFSYPDLPCMECLPKLGEKWPPCSQGEMAWWIFPTALRSSLVGMEFCGTWPGSLVVDFCVKKGCRSRWTK